MVGEERGTSLEIPNHLRREALLEKTELGIRKAVLLRFKDILIVGMFHVKQCLSQPTFRPGNLGVSSRFRAG